ncbi:PKD domain-containing protein [Algibacter miyuki]|uniref:PKD domain-containing protein n=1 Tax=Algibacter miyuki TaxID=1306933 RepID=A0ABV5GVF4_9FLAO|nr:PKD domain-containing protein [Algibacter miyuki]MDN3664823.1 PKD domain-containing protein [Algibacter miyuki]
MKTFKYITILILSLSFLGCENDDDAVLPQVVAGFTYTLNIDTGVVTFINTSENGNTYSWNFGDGETSTLINPINVYPNGTYTVTLEVKNVAGSSDIFEDEIIILIPETAALPISFDGEGTTYEATTFNGAAFSVVDNPDLTGANETASKVGEITNSGAAYEGFFFDLGLPLDLTVNKTVKALFWSNTPVDVLLKLEEGTADAVETTASHGGTGWEAIYFTFDSAASYNRFTMFVDAAGTTAGTFYIDDISQIATVDVPCTQTLLEAPIDFDCNGIDYATKIVGNVSFEVVDNPELSGINAEASKVGKITNVGANWENAFFNLDTPIDFTTDKGVSIKLFSNEALDIKLKFEDGTEGAIEADVTHTGSGWEALTFTFESTASYNDMILFVDGPGTAAGTFYIDDITQVAGVVATTCEAEIMQSLLAADFNLTFMSDPSASITQDATTFVWADNPNADNTVNSSCKVGQVTKTATNPWDNIQINLDSKLDFSANGGFNMNVYSEQPGFTVLLKLESIADPGVNTEIELTTTKTNEWEALSFAFTSNHDAKYDRIVIIFDLSAANTNTYYFDDLKLFERTSGGGSSSAYSLDQTIDFEPTGFGANWTWNVFENGANNPLEFVSNPNASGINTSATVAKITASTAGAPWVGTEIAHGEITNAWEVSASNTIIKIMVYKTVISDVGLKLASANGGAQAEVKVANTKINEWEELTFDFSHLLNIIGQDGTTNIDQVIVFPDFVEGRATDNVVYFDNITFNKFEVSAENDASLSNLLVDGSTISGFNTDTLEYSVALAEGTTTVPTVTATSTEGSANVVITPAGALPGETTIEVTAADGTTKLTYKVAFSVQVAMSGWTTSDGIDFEPTGFGANWTWNVFENGANAPLEFVANPNASGINTSATVAKITATTAGAPWVGTEVAHGEITNAWEVNASNTTIKIMVYKTVISDVALKLASANGGAQAEVKVANTKINEWEELTFDFSHLLSIIGQDGTTNIDQVIVFPDFVEGRATDNVVYFDNITFHSN